MAPKDIGALFDEIYESRVTFVIDTSASMFHKLRLVKRQIMDNLDALCVRPDAAINLVQFSGEVSQWARRTSRCTPETADAAKEWLWKLRAESGTNSEAAILSAFDDDTCQAVYLVTDGLPESNASDFLDRVARASARRPVHCAYLEGGASDGAAVDLFYELAKRTSGSLSLVKVGECGTVQRVTRLYRLNRFAYRSRSSAAEGASGGTGKHRSDRRKTDAGGGKKVQPSEDSEPAEVYCLPSSPIGALPVFHPFYRVTNAFSPHQLLPPHKAPRVYVNGKQTVVRAPCVGYRWPYVDYYYPYGGAPWTWWVGGGGSEGRRRSKEAAHTSDEKSSDSERTHSDNDESASESDGEAATGSAADDDERARLSQPLVPDTGMTASEIEARADRQIARYEGEQRRRLRTCGRRTEKFNNDSESNYSESLREIFSLESKLEQKIRELNTSTALRQCSINDEIQAGQRERAMLQQKLEGLQKHRQALSRARERYIHEIGSTAQKEVSFNEGRNTRHHYDDHSSSARSSDTSKTASTARLESKPSNESWMSTRSDNRERRPPWGRYWRAI